jgi:hypothetical protein
MLSRLPDGQNSRLSQTASCSADSAQFYYLDQTQPAAVQCWLELWMSWTKHSKVERNELTVVMCYRKTQLNKHSANAPINNNTNATAVQYCTSLSPRALDEHVLVVLVIVIAATVARTVASTTTPTLVHVVIVFLVVHAEVVGGLRVLDVVQDAGRGGGC